MQTYNIKSRRRQWTSFDTTIKSIRVYSDPKHMFSPDKWANSGASIMEGMVFPPSSIISDEEAYYEFRFDIVQDEGDERPVSMVSYTVFPMDRDTIHRVNEEGYTNPNTDLVMNERYILFPEHHRHDIIVEFFGDYSSVVIYGLPDEACVVVDWVGVTDD